MHRLCVSSSAEKRWRFNRHAAAGIILLYRNNIKRNFTRMHNHRRAGKAPLQHVAAAKLISPEPNRARCHWIGPPEDNRRAPAAAFDVSDRVLWDPTFSGSGNGAQGRNRTTDTAIFSRMLYQLSYLGLSPLWRSQGGLPQPGRGIKPLRETVEGLRPGPRAVPE